MIEEQEKLIQELFDNAVVAIAKGQSSKFIVNQYVGMGIPKEAAMSIVSQAKELKKREFRKAGLKTIAFGIGWFLLGAVITGITYSAASSGGHYIITSGLFLVGGITVLKGVWRIIVG
ncbi:hypothetical protein [Vibrio parahaemolyticus]|uniref:hypothetical protein n=1 Tax=Vibrio parahaemolyticus TaxID=670 RepID=UPI001EE9E460|nr:hypothetical protein [Vibrio parahaemolyticus]MCG6451296.1 hypothetical protein [Vibrio parahaemolyticus]